MKTLLPLVEAVRDELNQRLRGLGETVDLALAAFLGGGHLLLEGPPGTGKTSLAKAISQAFGGTFRRVQMTSDLLPSDIVGILRMRPGSQDFEFREGPVFSNFLLADEINRSSPKTQSALLEAMAEGTVSVDGRSYPLPRPFFVVATQNPLEYHGVYPLAESQLDRFMIQLNVEAPPLEDELAIYLRGASTQAQSEAPARTLTLEQALRAREEAASVFVELSVVEYLTELVRATRERAGISTGVSVRGGLQLLAAAKGLAYVRGREFVLPADIAAMAVPALAHRLCFSDEEASTRRRAQWVRETLDAVRAPK